MTGLTAQSWVAVLLVLALVAALAYLTKKGALGALGRKGKAIQVETAVPLGDRRSLVIVAIEGRRLLLGLTPAQVSLVTELAPPQAFEPAFSEASADEPHLDSRT
jgi:flagellar biosynthetic protein FliO